MKKRSFKEYIDGKTDLTEINWQDFWSGVGQTASGTKDAAAGAVGATGSLLGMTGAAMQGDKDQMGVAASGGKDRLGKAAGGMGGMFSGLMNAGKALFADPSVDTMTGKIAKKVDDPSYPGLDQAVAPLQQYIAARNDKAKSPQPQSTVNTPANQGRKPTHRIRGKEYY